MLQIVHFLFNMPVVYRLHPPFSMLMQLRMLKLSVGKGRHVMKQLCCGVLQYYAIIIVATERALYRALVVIAIWGSTTKFNSRQCAATYMYTAANVHAHF